MTRPGHDGIPPQGPEFAEFLRRALHAAADQVEPRPDGLERIRARVQSGPAYASKHAQAGASGGFLADLVRRWNAAKGGAGEPGGSRPQPWKWKYGLFRPALAIACAVFAIGVVLAVPPLRGAMVQLGSTVVGISPSSSQGTESQAGTGRPIGQASGGAVPRGASAGQVSGTATACSPSPSSTATAEPGTAKTVSPHVVAGGSVPSSPPASNASPAGGSASSTASPSDSPAGTATPPASSSAPATKTTSPPASAAASTSATGSQRDTQASANPCRSATPTQSQTTEPAVTTSPPTVASSPPSTPSSPRSSPPVKDGGATTPPDNSSPSAGPGTNTNGTDVGSTGAVSKGAESAGAESTGAGASSTSSTSSP